MRDPHTILVLATFFAGLGLISFLSGWAEGRFSKLGFVLTASAIGMFVWVQMTVGIQAASIPEAFIEIIARLLR